MTVQKRISSILSDIDNKRQKMNTSQDIHDLIQILEDKKQFNDKVNTEIDSNMNSIINYYNKQSLKLVVREKDDLIYRTYYKEGGIKQILESLDEVIHYRLDEYDQPEMLVAAVYTSRLEIARYLLDKLDKEVQNLGVVDGNDTIDFKSLGFIDYTEDITKTEKNLKRLVHEIRSNQKSNQNNIENKLRLISADVEAINPKKNLDLLHRFMSKVSEDNDKNSISLYIGLLYELKKVLNSPVIDMLKNMEKMNIDNYKAQAMQVGNIIDEKILSKWHNN